MNQTNYHDAAYLALDLGMQPSPHQTADRRTRSVNKCSIQTWVVLSRALAGEKQLYRTNKAMKAALRRRHLLSFGKRLQW